VEVKDSVRALLDRLPEDCTLDDVLYHVYVLDQVSRGFRDVDAGRTIPQAQVRERLRLRWLSESAK
jgi:hypothetical protein